ncbi:MAG TPA: RT0821/Lpp0805 family surface protein [Steroidobacter sp.]|uniref:RT0821/Lpp0805 family surface protein n=1 Tax=Steroidobacter sp. TaxID=1978227 RepID=UPI002EDAFEFA
MFTRLFKPVFVALLCASILSSAPALSDPPDHAKAHGWRKKHDPRYVGYTGGEWEYDYGVREGSCNRKAIGTVVGAVAGGVIGSQIGDGTGRTVAIIAGTVLGGLIGREIGEDLDEGDRGCFGHALELAEPGRSVSWVNDRTHVSYVLTPLALSSKDSKNCRRFKLKASEGKKSKSSEGRACRDSSGVWRMG